MRVVASLVWQQRESKQNANPGCVLQQVLVLTFRGGVCTARSTQAASKARPGKAPQSFLIRDNGLLHISPRHVMTPDGQTTLHFRPRFTKNLFLVLVSPPTWGGKGMGWHMPLLPPPCTPRNEYLKQKVF